MLEENFNIEKFIEVKKEEIRKLETRQNIIKLPLEVLWVLVVVPIIKYAPFLLDSLEEISALVMLIGGTGLWHIGTILNGDKKRQNIEQEIDIANLLKEQQEENVSLKNSKTISNGKKINNSQLDSSVLVVKEDLVKADLIEEWNAYVLASDETTIKINEIVTICLEELYGGISTENLMLMLQDFNLSFEDLEGIVALVIHFSPRGEELREYWNKLYPEYEIKYLNRTR